MLRVDVVLCPGGNELRSRTLGSIRIANISELADLSNYAVLSDAYGTAMIRKHRRSDGWLPLVARALTALNRRRANEPDI